MRTLLLQIGVDHFFAQSLICAGYQSNRPVMHESA
jgi:hypothetical protein